MKLGRRRWTAKPPAGTDLDRSHPSCPDHCWPFLSPQGSTQTLTRRGRIPTPSQAIYSGSQSYVPGGKYGLSVRHAASTDHVNLAEVPADVDTIVGLTSGHSLLICYRKTDSTARVSTAIGVNGSLGGADAHLLCLPFSDGTAIWRYSTAGANDVIVAGLTFGDDLWVSTVGARGMELWQNGILRGSNAANPARSASGSYFGCPAGTTTWADNADLALVMTWRRQLSSAEVRALSVNPWQVFEPQPGLGALTDAGSPAVIVALDWIPIMPDRIHTRHPVREGGLTMPATVLPNAPAPDILAALAFTPRYPDRVYHRKQQPPAGMVEPFAPVTVPPPDLDASLTFQPIYPSRVPHRHSQIHTTWVAPLLGGQPLGWLPILPARVPHRTSWRQIPSVVAPPLGPLVVVAQSLAWLPHAPDQVPHRRPARLGGLTQTVLPAVALGGLQCITLADQNLTTPTVITEAVTAAQIRTEGLGAPTVLHEDLC